jgi:hypothetical protein
MKKFYRVEVLVHNKMSYGWDDRSWVCVSAKGEIRLLDRREAEFNSLEEAHAAARYYYDNEKELLDEGNEVFLRGEYKIHEYFRV